MIKPVKAKLLERPRIRFDLHGLKQTHTIRIMGILLHDAIKAVFFDHDDTLVGTMAAKWAQHKFIAKKYYNKELLDAEIIEHWGKPLQELIGVLYGTDDAEQALVYTMAHHQEYPKIMFQETLPTLHHIKTMGKLMGVVTATNRFSFENDLALHHVPPELLDYTQTADETTYHKPNPKVFDPALKWLASRKVKPLEVLYVGDGLQDMKAALGAGFNFVGVQTGLVTAKQFKAEGAKSVPNISKLID